MDLACAAGATRRSVLKTSTGKAGVAKLAVAAEYSRCTTGEAWLLITGPWLAFAVAAVLMERSKQISGSDTCSRALGLCMSRSQEAHARPGVGKLEVLSSTARLDRHHLSLLPC